MYSELTQEKTHSVLVVEDQSDIREVMECVLGMEGYGVSTAETRDDALREVLRENPDVVLMDLYMPGMSAEDFVKRVRAFRPKVKIVLMTAGYKAEEAARKLGLKSFLRKPFDYADLLQVVHESVGRPTFE